MYRKNVTNQHIKSIAKLSDIDPDLIENPHYVRFKEGNTFTLDTSGHPIVGPFNEKRPAEIAVLHHYHTKSYKEYVHKRMRGRAMLKGYQAEAVRNAQERNIYEANLFDDTGWKMMKKYVPKYSFFDNF